MRIVSVNVSPIRTVSYRGKDVGTGIFKESIAGRIKIHQLGMAKDSIADFRYHGGANKAIYSYAEEHFTQWSQSLNRPILPGLFGENLTTTGLLENQVCLGDRYRFGTAILEAAQPRTPCFKLGIKMGDFRFPKQFLASGHTGIYWRVVQEGEVQAGDAIEIMEKSQDVITIRNIWEMVYQDRFDVEKAKIAVAKYAMGPEWKDSIELRLQEANS